MDNTPENWILKILSGVHVGAEVALSTTEVVLGQGESCDLVLDDVSLSDRHISLRMEAEQALLTLLDTDRPIYVGGQKLERSDAQTLEPFQLIAIGTLFLAVGPPDVKWPAIDLQNEQKMMALPEDKATPVAGEDTPPDEDDAEATPATTDPGSRQPRFIVAAVSILLLVLTVSVLWLLLTSGASAPTLEEIETRVQQIASRYDAVVEVTQEAEEDTHITGYVETEGKRQDFLAALEGSGIVAETNVISAQQIASSLTLMLDNEFNRGGVNQVEIVSVPGFPGDFILKGYVGDANLWQSTLARIQRQTNYHRLDDEVQTLDDRIAALEKMLVAANLEDVEIRPGNRGLLALQGKTEVGAEAEQRLADVIEAFNRAFKSYPPLTTPKEGESSGSSSLKLDIHGVSFGEVPHITLDGKRRYGEGSLLENGYVIKSINPDYILLQKGGKEYYYYLNEIH